MARIPRIDLGDRVACRAVAVLGELWAQRNCSHQPGGYRKFVITGDVVGEHGSGRKRKWTVQWENGQRSNVTPRALELVAFERAS